MAKLSGEEQKKFVREKLAEQCHLLRKSINEFVSGDLAEAVRLAVAMRVLVMKQAGTSPYSGNSRETTSS
jgi:hypothetical protein